MYTIAIKSLFNIHPVVYSNIESGIFFLPTLNVVRTLFVDILSGNSVVYIFFEAESNAETKQITEYSRGVRISM